MAWLKLVALGNIRALGAQVACRNSHSVVALRGVLKFSSVQFSLALLQVTRSSKTLLKADGVGALFP